MDMLQRLLFKSGRAILNVLVNELNKMEPRDDKDSKKDIHKCDNCDNGKSDTKSAENIFPGEAE